ncbi:MAG: hypothetical protein H7Z75_13740, partial [Ferruginibacter sp.]|nr:hypothetical protein [Cytophagales bacterium]
MSTPLPLLPPAAHAPAGANLYPTRPRWRWVFLLAGLLATAAQAQPQLVKDINTTAPTSADLVPANFTNVGGVLFFTSFHPATGRELWTSDGTPEGTRPVADLRPGPDASSISNLTNVDGILYFTADNGTTGAELYQSDGTPQGTRLVKDLTPGPAPSALSNLTGAGGLLFFTLPDPTTPARRDLWRSDGTPEGTYALRCSCPEPTSFNPPELRAVGRTLYFVADIGINDRELWKSDGTPAGTVLVKDINAGAADPSPNVLRYLTNVEGVLYLSAYEPVFGYELWKSDGTEAGTVLVSDLGPGSASSSPYQLTNAAGLLYFTTYGDGIRRQELWKSDGTETGTVLLSGGGTGQYPPGRFDLTSAGRMLYFLVYQRISTSGANTMLLWKSDGTPEGTVPLRDPVSGNAFFNDTSTQPFFRTSVGGVLYFVQYRYDSRKLYRSDGTPAGTGLVKDFFPGSGLGRGTPANNLTTVGGTLYFTDFSPVTGRALWKSDGTEAGSVQVSDFFLGTASSSPLLKPASAGGVLYFAANDGVNGRELWKSNGTPEGTVLVKDIYPGPITLYPYAGNSDPTDLTNVGGVIYFLAANRLNQRGLWKSDGTPEGTGQVWLSGYADNLISANGVLYITDDRDLWGSNGTPGGTVPLLTGKKSPYGLTNVNGTLYFGAYGSGGHELWKTDGTATGTILIKNDFQGGASLLLWLTNVNGTLYFSTSGGIDGEELWKSDGTPEGTVLVKDIYPGAAGSSPAYLTNVNGTLYFTAYNATNRRELWKSDGTEAGTVLIKAPIPGSQWSSLSNLVNAGGTLCFSASDGVNGVELWKSDGTQAG